MNTKHKADGASSILKATFTKNKIDLDKDELSIAAAIVANDSYLNYNALAAKAKKDRDTNFDPAFAFMKLGLQNIKNFNGGDVKELIFWGATLVAEQIVYPSAFTECYKMWGKFYAYHTSQAAASPLISFAADNAYDIGALNTAALLSPQNNDDYNDHLKSAELQKKERDVLMKPVVKNMRTAGNFLKSHFPTNPKKCGDWGLEVDDSPQAPKDRKTILGFGVTRVIKTARINGYITNIGLVNVSIYKGKKAVGTEKVLKPGEKMGILVGYSTITIVNTSMLEKAIVTVTR